MVCKRWLHCCMRIHTIIRQKHLARRAAQVHWQTVCRCFCTAVRHCSCVCSWSVTVTKCGLGWVNKRYIYVGSAVLLAGAAAYKAIAALSVPRVCPSRSALQPQTTVSLIHMSRCIGLLRRRHVSCASFTQGNKRRHSAHLVRLRWPLRELISCKAPQ